MEHTEDISDKFTLVKYAVLCGIPLVLIVLYRGGGMIVKPFTRQLSGADCHNCVSLLVRCVVGVFLRLYTKKYQ